MTHEESIKKDVWQTVQEANRAWTVEANTEKLRQYFHPRMVAIVPSAKQRIEGQAACIAGWKSFVDTVKTLSWVELDPAIELYHEGSVAIVTYYYDMQVQMGGREMRLTGRDMMTLCLEKGRWWIVSDQFSSNPS